MKRIVLAFGKEETARHINEILSAGGVEVRGIVKSGAEAKRMISWMEGGLVICGVRLPDMSAAELALDLSGRGILLVMGNPAALDAIDARPGDNIFKLSAPAQKFEVLASVKMLSQLDEKQFAFLVPSKSDSDKELIAKAKAELMEHRGMAEPQAHRYIQSQSMARGIKSADAARRILAQYDNTE